MDGQYYAVVANDAGLLQIVSCDSQSQNRARQMARAAGRMVLYVTKSYTAAANHLRHLQSLNSQSDDDE